MIISICGLLILIKTVPIAPRYFPSEEFFTLFPTAKDQRNQNVKEKLHYRSDSALFFNSIDFAIFLPVVFFFYWFVTNRNLRVQNGLLLIASYVFYGWWDWRFLSLIVFSSFVDYCVGIGLSKVKELPKRKLLLWVSIIVNLGFLGFFKYSNFFLDNFVDAFKFAGHPISAQSLNIILPVGISFYTFQTLSYSIDVYRGKLEPTKDIIAFFAFVSFFPQLVAGPIERATNLLPQFGKARYFDYNKTVDGMRQILWGLFKKVVIANNCATFANDIFNNYSNCSGSTLVLGVLFFSIQIYGDFSGYSDIAIGTSRLFGFNLKQNFAFPYFSRDIGEFWRRWHISLSSWFRDYLYIPIGGSSGNRWLRVRNTFIIFIVSGFWHGANWTFVFWGALNALYFLPLLIMKKNRRYTDIVAEGNKLPTPKEFMNMSVTFGLTTFAWIFFRAESMEQSIGFVLGIFSVSLFSIPSLPTAGYPVIILVICFFGFEWIGRGGLHALERVVKLPLFIRWNMYFSLVVLLFVYSGNDQPFIYFQF